MGIQAGTERSVQRVQGVHDKHGHEYSEGWKYSLLFAWTCFHMVNRRAHIRDGSTDDR